MKTNEEIIKEVLKNIWTVKAEDIDEQVRGERNRLMTDLTEVREAIAEAFELKDKQFQEVVARLKEADLELEANLVNRLHAEEWEIINEEFNKHREKKQKIFGEFSEEGEGK